MATIVGCLPIRLPTISGRNCTHFCKDTLVPMPGKRKSVAVSSKLFTGFCAPAPSGVNCQPTLGSGTASSSATHAGKRTVFGVFKQFAQDPDMAAVMPDSTGTRPYVRSGRLQKKGASERTVPRSEPGSQDPSPVDALGFRLPFILTGDERHDLSQAESLLAPFHFDAVIADKGYDSDPLRELLTAKQVEVVIPSRRYRKQPRDYDRLR